MYTRTSLVAQMVKHLPAMRETRVQFLGWEDLLEKEMATHSSILAWRIPWTEEPGGLQSIRSQSWTQLSDFTFTFHFHILKSHPVWRSRYRKGDNWHKQIPWHHPQHPRPSVKDRLEVSDGSGPNGTLDSAEPSEGRRAPPATLGAVGTPPPWFTCQQQACPSLSFPIRASQKPPHPVLNQTAGGWGPGLELKIPHWA